MQGKKLIITVVAAFPTALTYGGAVEAEDLENNAVRIGYANVHFNLQSGDLTGPPGTTPPGLRIGAKDLDILAISYERRLSSSWALQFQAGIPPTLTAVGAGAATPFVTLLPWAGPGPPRRTEIAAAASRAWTASSGMRRGVSRNAGPQMSTAATTLPRASWTGAETALSPSSYSPIAVA